MSLTFTGNSPNGVKNFRRVYQQLQRAGSGRHRQIDLTRVPYFLSEGDSWFSIPIHHNIVDFLELAYRDGVFLRFEESGDVLSSILSGKSKRNLLGYTGQFTFDALLISGGGNDLVDELVVVEDSGQQDISVEQTLDLLDGSGFYHRMRHLYQSFADELATVDSSLNIISHTYDYPRLIGKPMSLTVSNIGLVGLVIDHIGSWIAPKIERALPRPEDKLEFVTKLIDRFESEVLSKVTASNFHYADLRGTLTQDSDWNDEMHPSEAAYQKLALRYKQCVDQIIGPKYRGLDLDSQ